MSALVWLLSGYLHAERGEGQAAERAFRSALRRNGHPRLAQLALAAVLLRRGSERGDEVRALVASPTGSAVGASWQRLLQIDAVEAVEQAEAKVGVVKSLGLVLDAAPAQRALIDFGSHALARQCQFQRAGALLRERLVEPGTRALRGIVALQGGRDETAVELLRAAEQTPRVRLHLLRALLHTRRLEEARALLPVMGSQLDGAAGLALYLDPRADQASLAQRTGTPRTATFSLVLASAALARDDLALALRSAHLLSDRPQLAPRAHWIAAEALLQQGKLDEALSEAEAAVARCPGFAAGYELVGCLYLQQDSFSAAEKALRAAEEAGLRTSSVLLGLARALAELGAHEQAARLLDQAEKAGGPESELWIARGQLALAARKPQQCLAALNKVTEDRLESRVLRARALIAAGQLAQAELVLLDAARQRPDQPLLELLLGGLLQRQHSPKASRHLERALELAGDRPLHRRTVARTHVLLAEATAGKNGRPTPQSVEHLAAAMRADASLAAAYVALGRFELFEDKLESARRALERATEMDPRDPTAYFLLAVAQRGDDDAVRQTYLRFLQLEPEGRRAAHALRELAKLK